MHKRPINIVSSLNCNKINNPLNKRKDKNYVKNNSGQNTK